MYIQDVMRAPVITIAADARLEQARAVMQRARIKRLPVLHDGTVIGLLTLWELRRAMALNKSWQTRDEHLKRCRRLRVRDVMTQRIVALAPDTPAREAARLVWEGQTGCILVLHAGKLVGMVTTTDLLDVLAAFLDSQWPDSYRHLLVPTDFSTASVHSIRKAVALARQHQANITLLYVLPRLSTLIAADVDHLSADIVGRIVEDCRTEALQRLAELIPPDATSLITYEAVDGVPAIEIIRAAVRLEADLIIMGRCRRRRLKRLFARSVGKEVMRRAPCPVLVVEVPTRYEVVRAGYEKN